jgi:Na+/H+-dicarboxylate symporter
MILLRRKTMKKIWSNYKQTIILLGALIIGAIVGLVWGEKAAVLSPFGDLFMNLMFVIIVPLIFLTITTSIAKIKQPKRLGKVITTIFGVFIVTTLVSVAIGLITTFAFELVNPSDSQAIIESLATGGTVEQEELNILQRTVEAISVNDFSAILSRNNIIPLVIFSILVGLAITKVGKEADPFLNVLEAANKVVLKFVDFVFIYAPIGLGCYFASLIGTFGASIATGFLKTFVIYTVVSILFYFIMYSLYAYISAGKDGVKAFWKNILPATATSISTCSSAASIPVNIKCTKAIGVSDDIAETTVPLGTSFHKDGSVIGSVFKIMFLVYLFGGIETVNIGQVIITALIANLLVTAVPVGGGTISEMMIITMMGFEPAALPILTIIATIIDPPATMLNVVGDTSSSMLVARVVDGKDWIKKNNKKVIEVKEEVEEEVTKSNIKGTKKNKKKA